MCTLKRSSDSCVEGGLEQASVDAERPAAKVQAKINEVPTNAATEGREKAQDFSKKSVLAKEASAER